MVNEAMETKLAEVDKPKRATLTEVGTMLKIERLLAELDPFARRRIVFYFADEVGLTYVPPVNGESKAD